MSSSFSSGINTSPKLKERPPSKAIRNPNPIISSRNLAVAAFPDFANTEPMISRNDFFVKISLIYPKLEGTT